MNQPSSNIAITQDEVLAVLVSMGEDPNGSRVQAVHAELANASLREGQGEPTARQAISEACSRIDARKIIEQLSVGDLRDRIDAVQRARDVLAGYPSKEKVADLYDEDAEFAGALRDLAGPEFEYPDYSWLTVEKAVQKAAASSRGELSVFRHPRIRSAFDEAALDLQSDKQRHTGSYSNAARFRMRDRIIEMLHAAATAGQWRVQLSDALPGARETVEENESDRKDLESAINSTLPLISVLSDAGMRIHGQYCLDPREAIEGVLARHPSVAGRAVDEILDLVDHVRFDDVTGSALVGPDARGTVAQLEIERQLMERGVLSAPSAEQKAGQDFVILIAPADPRSYLALESDEDDASVYPPRTRDSDMAARFDTEEAAQAALTDAVKRYPRNAFRIDTVPPLGQEQNVVAGTDAQALDL